ncbi:MAG: carboxypeptidase regulatory-like domain-containing protein [Bacteroidetes bacterium]|nr:carboxypeptidase regulatory-like domain-containing protein [Bacteroidota bacterium]
MKLSCSKVLLLFIVPCLTLFFACKKEPGTGGLATIKGRVYAYDVNDFGNKLDSGYYGGVRVYISYGDNTGVDDDVRTDFEGRYEFRWLQPGSYKVWVLSDCNTCTLLQTQDLELVNVNKKREEVQVRDLIYQF